MRHDLRIVNKFNRFLIHLLFQNINGPASKCRTQDGQETRSEEGQKETQEALRHNLIL